MSAIRFQTQLFKIDNWTILRLPKEASAKLPSRGLSMVKGTVDGSPVQTALEPDGKGSHWFRIDDSLGKALNVAAGDTVKLEIEPTKAWPEPDVPADIQKGLAANKPAQNLWVKITPMARWEWIRWIRATNKDETRKRRIEVACSKLKSGERRPCCFNSNMCTEPKVSKGGVLLEPIQTAKK